MDPPSSSLTRVPFELVPRSSRFPILPTVPTADPRNAIRAQIFSRSTTTFAELCVFLLIRSSMNPTFCGICVCGPLQFKRQFISYIGAVRSSIDMLFLFAWFCPCF